MHASSLAVLLIGWGLFSCQSPSTSGATEFRFEVSVPAERSSDVLDGRVLVMISKREGEPRFQVGDGAASQQIFGIDVDGLKAGEPAVVDASVFGYPRPSLADIPPGEYWVQGLLHIYETFERSDGHTVKLPMDQG